VIKLHDCVIWPKRSADFLSCYDLSGALDEHFKNLEGLFLKENLVLALEQFSSLEVELEWTEANNLG
jgi:hypothetical protein